MNQNSLLSVPGAIVYPDSDGQPLSDNTKQFRWIAVLQGNIAALFRDVPDVFVAGDLLWYPVEGHPEVRIGPDVMVIFGRPKGDRGSYMQWVEDNVAPTVVFGVLSPKNTPTEMADKQFFYEEHGVEEYYVYNPDENHLQVYLRRGEVLRRIHPANGFTSPRLGITFDLSGPEMVVRYPDGRPFRTFEDLMAEYERSQREQVEAAQQVAEARQHAAQAELRAEQARQRATRLAELSRKARRGQAAPEELAELERLEEETSSGPP